MALSRTLSIVTVSIAVLTAAGGALVAGDTRYVLSAVYAAEQKTLTSQLTAVNLVVLKSDRRQILSQIFQLEVKPQTGLTSFEKQRLRELKTELTDVQRQITKVSR
jgi:hypothetical protein